MKRIWLTLAVLLALVTTGAHAQLVGKGIGVAALGSACNQANQVAYVIDAESASSLGSGGGTVQVWARCVSSVWTIDEVGAVADLSAYVLVTKAGAQSITATGSGNDITLTTAASGDDLIFAAGDALTVTTGGAASIVTTAGAVTLTAGGTTQDVTINSVDDIALAATDDTTVAGDNVSVTSTTVTLNPGGSTVELALAAGSSTFLGSLILPIASAPPAACASGTKGTVYYDSDINKLCLCNGTNYVLVNDDSTTTGCS